MDTTKDGNGLQSYIAVATRSGVQPLYNAYCDIVASKNPSHTNIATDRSIACSCNTLGIYTMAITGVYPGFGYGLTSDNFNKIPDPNTEIPDTSSVLDMSLKDSTMLGEWCEHSRWSTPRVFEPKILRHYWSRYVGSQRLDY